MTIGNLISASMVLALIGCVDTGPDNCTGTFIAAPESAEEEGGFTVPQLMAQAAAMGMTQQEAETLIYLEGLSPQATLKRGQSICLDGTPDR